VTHPIDLVVDGGFLLDIRVRLRDVRLGLEVVVVRDEILDGSSREEPAKLLVELRRQSLVVRQHQRRPVRSRHHLRDGEGLSGSRHAQQDLIASPLGETRGQGRYRRRLIAGGPVLGNELESRHDALRGDSTFPLEAARRAS